MKTCFAPSVPTRYDPITKSRASSIDMRPVMAFGNLRVLLSHSAQVGPEAIDTAIDEIERGLLDYRAGDYIVAVGDPVLIGAAMAIAAGLTDGPIRVLRWSRATNNYQALEVML